MKQLSNKLFGRNTAYKVHVAPAQPKDSDAEASGISHAPRNPVSEQSWVADQASEHNHDSPSVDQADLDRDIKATLETGIVRAEMHSVHARRVEAERIYRDLLQLCEHALDNAPGSVALDSLVILQRKIMYGLADTLEKREKYTDAKPYYDLLARHNYPGAHQAIDRLNAYIHQDAQSEQSTTVTALYRAQIGLLRTPKPPVIDEDVIPDVEGPASDSSSGVGLLLSYIQAGQSVVNQLKAQPLVLLIGKTGAGKSTIGNYLLGASLKEVRAKKLGLKGPNRAIVDERSPIAESFEIGHEKVSYTTVPQAVESPSGYWFCDCPGFKDSRGSERNIANGVTLQRMIKASKSVRLMLVLDYNTISGDRGEGAKSSLQIVMDLLGGESGLKTHQDALLIVINKAPEKQSDEDIIDECADCHPLFKDLQSSIMVLDPLESSTETRSTRQALLHRFNQMRSLGPAPVYTTLSLEDEKYLKAVTATAQTDIDDAIRQNNYDRVSERMTLIGQLNQLQHGYIERCLARIHSKVYESIQSKVDLIRQHSDAGDFDDAEQVLATLTQAAASLSKHGGPLENLPKQVSAGRTVIDKAQAIIQEKALLTQQLQDQSAQVAALLSRLDAQTAQAAAAAAQAQFDFAEKLSHLESQLATVTQTSKQQHEAEIAALVAKQADQVAALEAKLTQYNQGHPAPEKSEPEKLKPPDSPAVPAKPVAIPVAAIQATPVLANTATAQETVNLANQTLDDPVKQRALYIKAIAQDSACAHAYYNLAVTLGAKEQVQLENGSSMSRQALYLKAIALATGEMPQSKPITI